ncbi:Abortive infection bacteriophage resistance protein [uncultured Candidatus Thioglobus sp.]|nr:Abortive infection bacteriophage resistance protein [uncultured Candidatus Thioglobus sp.]
MSKIPYQKKPLTFNEQVDLLKERGMLIDDDKKAIYHLSSIGYYRLSAYWHPFRIRKDNQILDNFKPDTYWQQVIELYEFDRELRLLVMDAIERIEVTIRTQITYKLSHQYDAFFYLEEKYFHSKFKHLEWLKHISKEIDYSKDTFITHFNKKYKDKKPPIWMATEVISLGKLSKLYSGLKNEDKRLVSNFFDIPWQRLKSWLHVVAYIRNVCAHHSRLWNRELSIRANDSKDNEWLTPITPRNDRIFYVLLILRFLMKRSNNGEDWRQKINELLKQFENNEDALKMMGVPNNWQEHPIWK